jgi:hypothetical protein
MPGRFDAVNVEVIRWNKMHQLLVTVRNLQNTVDGENETWDGNPATNYVFWMLSLLASENFVALILARRPKPIRMAAFHQALKGLAAFHAAGIIHRDVKPANLFVVSYDPVRVVPGDYGYATLKT